MKSSFPSPLGAYSKAVPGSVVVNFSRSASDACDDTCRFKTNGGCYAANYESFRPTLRTRAAIRELDPVAWVRSLVERKHLSQLKHAPWIRFSAFGAMPPLRAHGASVTQGALRAFLSVVASRLDHGRVHLPVESEAKADTYAELGFHPRLSLSHGADDLQRASEALSRGLSVSLVSPADRSVKGWMAESKVQARAWAKQLRQLWPNRRIKVCPAIIGSAKCGDCRLCASGPGAADVVVYPEHL